MADEGHLEKKNVLCNGDAFNVFYAKNSHIIVVKVVTDVVA